MGKKKKFLYILIVLNLFFGHTVLVQGQLQTFDFSANNPESYQCFNKDTGENLTDGEGDPAIAVNGPDDFGNYYCCAGIVAPGPIALGGCPAGQAKIIAQIKPPTLQQIEVWFVRILYAIWGLVASLSFLFLVKLGYEYTISRGDPTKITEVRKKIVSYIIGFSLVFLAIPILTTAFRLLGINTNAQCYNVNLPGFQFFFTSLCTDPKGVIAAKFAADPCAAFDSGSEPEGVICKGTSYEGQTTGACPAGTGVIRLFQTVTLTCQVQEGDTAATWCRTTRLFNSDSFCTSSCNPSSCSP